MRFRVLKLLSGKTSVAIYDTLKDRYIPLSVANEFNPIPFMENNEILSEDLLSMLELYSADKSIKEQLRDVIRDNFEIDFSEHIENIEDCIPFEIKALRTCSIFENYEIEMNKMFNKNFNPIKYSVLKAIGKLTSKNMFYPNDNFYVAPTIERANHLQVYPSSCEVSYPSFVTKLDYETKLGAIIGNTDISNRNLSPEESLEKIVGFVLMEDFVCRNIQYKKLGNRNNPIFSVISSEVLTPEDILPFFDDLHPKVYLNSELVSEGSSVTNVWKIEELISYASDSNSIHKGEIISVGSFPRSSGLALDKQIIQGASLKVLLKNTEIDVKIGEKEINDYWRVRYTFIKRMVDSYSISFLFILAFLLSIWFARDYYFKHRKNKKNKNGKKE